MLAGLRNTEPQWQKIMLISNQYMPQISYSQNSIGIFESQMLWFQGLNWFVPSYLNCLSPAYNHLNQVKQLMQGMDIRQKLRQRYQQILQIGQEINQFVKSTPNQVAQNLSRRRQAYQSIVSQIVLQIKTAKSFAQEKQKQLESISSQSKLIVKWAAKRGKTFSKEIQRQQSLKQTLTLIKQTKSKMIEHKRHFQEIKKDDTLDYSEQKIQSNQYQSIVKNMRQEKIKRMQKQKSADLIYQNGAKRQKEDSKNQMWIQTKQRPQSTSVEQKKGSKKQVSFIDYRSQSNLRKGIKVDLRNESLQLVVVGKEGIRSVKNYQFGFKREKQIFVPKNKNETKQAKQILWNFNYHKDPKKLEKDLAKLV